MNSLFNKKFYINNEKLQVEETWQREKQIIKLENRIVKFKTKYIYS